MKLGFVSAILPDLSFEEVLSTAKSTGFDCVEIMCWPVGKAERRYAGVTHLSVGEFDQAAARVVTQQVADSGVSLSGLGYYPNLLSADLLESEVAREHLLRVIDAAALLELPVVNTFVGRDPKKSLNENWPRFLEVWPAIVKHAESRQVKIGIENCPMLFSEDEWPGGKNLAHSPAVWRRMFEDIPSDYFGLNYDPSHLVWQVIDPIEPIWEFSSKIFHAHAKDARVDRARLNDVGILGTPLQFHTPKLPGLGEMNWGRFFSVLGEVGYTGPVCVEVEDRVYEGTLDGRRAALKQSHDYLRNYIPSWSE